MNGILFCLVMSCLCLGIYAFGEKDDTLLVMATVYAVGVTILTELVNKK